MASGLSGLSWVPQCHQLPARSSPRAISAVRPSGRVLRDARRLRGGGLPVGDRPRKQKKEGAVVPPLRLEGLAASHSWSSGTLSSSLPAARSNGELSSTRAFLDSIAAVPELPARPSARVTTWKSQMQRKKRLPSGLEWDSLSSSRLASPRISTHRSYELPDGKRRIGKTMAPPMFANTEANRLLKLLYSETKAHLATFKRPSSPSRIVPKDFPGYRLHKRVEGTWAYMPPDTRQEALNEWFIKRIKRPPPSTENVHVAFGRITYPVINPRRKKRAPEPPPPLVEVPKMTLGPRKSVAK